MLDLEAQAVFLKFFGINGKTIAMLRFSLTHCRHWKTNQVVSADTHTNVPDRRHQTTRFHRAHVHAALLSHVDISSIYLNKRVLRAASSEKEAVLFFEDGTQAHGDVLIAADGIRSVCS